MSDITQNFNLTKDASTDYYSIDTVNANLEKIDKALGNTAKFETAGGTGTDIILTGIDLVEGHSKTFVASASNNGAVTTINGKNLYRPGTAQAPKLVAGKAITVWYNGTHFFIKASAEGDAVAENVLAGKTFSNDDDAGIAGGMPNNGPAITETIDLPNDGAEYIITKGFHSGLRRIRAKISGLVASVIKAETTVGGIVGTFTSDATAQDGDVLATKTYYRNGVKGTGSMVDRGTLNHTLPINGSYTIPAGKHSGSGKVTQSISTKAAATITPSTVNQVIASGQYLSGAQTIKGDANLISANILSGKSIFGVNGSAMSGKRYVSGIAYRDEGSFGTDVDLIKGTYKPQAFRVTVSGLTFKPSLIVLTHDMGPFEGKVIETMYRTNFVEGYTEVAKMMKSLYEASSASYSWFVRADTQGCYVNSTGFRLPIDTGVNSTSRPIAWVAYE